MLIHALPLQVLPQNRVSLLLLACQQKLRETVPRCYPTPFGTAFAITFNFRFESPIRYPCHICIGTVGFRYLEHLVRKKLYAGKIVVFDDTFEMVAESLIN